MMDPKDLIDWLSIDWTSLSPERNAERKAAADLLHRQAVRIAELEEELGVAELARRYDDRDTCREMLAHADEEAKRIRREVFSLALSVGGTDPGPLHDEIRQLRSDVKRLTAQRDQARRAYCLEAGIYVGDEDECRQLEPAELANRKGWPWPIADPEKEPTT
jgi:hypothetical protein